MNPDIGQLHSYPFEKLETLKAGIKPPASLPHIALSIGEPQHPPPGFICEELLTHLHTLANYPSTRGSEPLRTALATWVANRFQLPESSIDPEKHVLPVNGTREALFAFAQAVVDRSSSPVVVMPNPFYQIYEGAALLAGAQPWYLNTLAENDFIPDFESVPERIWKRCQLLYLCSPGNPSGAVINNETLSNLIHLARKHDFILAADECYSEIYADENNPPIGLLQAAAQLGNNDYQQCVVFHSLSKRSNVPGLRSGFIAGDAEILAQFLHYRTYHGCAMPLPTQNASIKAWQNEAHVRVNRASYRENFDAVLPILNQCMSVAQPDASFYLWPKTTIDDVTFARELYSQQNVTVLPGSFLSRKSDGCNPGSHHVRMALVAPVEECVEAAQRIRKFFDTL